MPVYMHGLHEARLHEKRPYTEAELYDIFWQHDKNRDCRLSRKELRGAFKELGAILPVFRAYRALRHADDNGDGYISEDEMEKLVNYAQRLNYRKLTINEQLIKGFFRHFDTDGDDRLSKQELIKAFERLGSRFPAWRTWRALCHADENGDGYISEEELDNLVKYVVKNGFAHNFGT